MPGSGEKIYKVGKYIGSIAHKKGYAIPGADSHFETEEFTITRYG